VSTLRGGITVLLIGAPGTGKSWMAGTVREVEGIETVLLLAPKPREINSFKYREHEIESEVFRDKRWQPAIKQYESGAFTKLYERVLSLYEDETYDAVILDPLTDVVWLAAHELLEPERAETPRDLRDSIGFYGALKYKLKGFTQALTGLASPDLAKPKHVIVTVHAQPTKEDQQLKGGGTKESSDHKAHGTEFLGDALPMIEGGYRREIAGEFDVVGFTNIAHELVRSNAKMERVAKYVVQLNADPERHAKAAIVPRLAQADIGNSMVDLFRVISEASNGSTIR
jgi:DNA replicative helicase MCM subunit Mcm2 (Cdc46/Mcm family)